MPGSAIAETVVFLLATVVLHSAIAFFILHSPGVELDDRRFLVIALVSAVIAGWILRRDTPFAALSIGQLPPLGLLVIVLLRAKLPDGAYDSLFYKATVPIMIGDWRTAITGAIDPSSLLGSNFQEIINSQLRIVDPAYPPALTATLAFLGLWVVVPVAAHSLMPKSLGPGYGLGRNTLVLLLVSLTESLVAAGTAYQEPLMGLLLAASLLPMSLGWLFLGAAIAVKATALFIGPLILVAKCWSLAASPGAGSTATTGHPGRWPRIRGAVAGFVGELVERSRSHRAVLGACIILAAVVVGQQFYRNIAYTGRLTAITESLSSLTDPENQVLAKQIDDPLAALLPRGFRERFVNTFIHVLTLDRWIPTREFGFHIIPSSRLPAIATALSLLVLAFPRFRRQRVLAVSFGTWLFCAFVLLNFVWQGRYLYPISFGAALVIAYLVGTMYQEEHEPGRRWLAVGACLAIAIAAFGDQLVGSYINDGWECRRNIAAPVVKNNYDRPETGFEHRLADIVANYRASSLRADVVPTILCESTLDEVRYLGAQYLYTRPSLEINRRRLAARPDLVKTLPTSLLAVCFTGAQFPDLILPPDVRKDFVEVEGARTQSGTVVHILVSKPLTSGARATSLFGQQMNPMSGLAGWGSNHDFLLLWGPDRLTSWAPADAPGGKGALIAQSGGDRVGVLIAPFSVAFDNVEFDSGSRLHVELAMPYSNSDGMGVEFAFEGSDAARASVTLAMSPKPEAATVPVWETRDVPVPPAINGRGSLTVTATSPSGDSNGDWIYFRQLHLTPGAR